MLTIGVGLLVVLATAAETAIGETLREGPSGPAALTIHGVNPQSPYPGAAAPLPTPPGTTTRVSVAGDGTQGDGASGGVNAALPSAKANQAISADGRWVAFVSAATNLIPGSPHAAGGLYLRDRQSGATVAVPWVNGGAFPVGVTAAEPAISADGGVVAFTALVTPTFSPGTLVAPAPTSYVLAWDRQTNTTAIVSIGSNGQPTPGWQPSISADGRYVAYTRWAPVPTPTPKLDTTAPSLSDLYASPNCVSPGGSSTISVTATDPDDSISSVSISISPPGGLAFTKSMGPVGGNVWTYTITAESGWTDGYVDYSVKASDSHGNATIASSTHDTSTTNYLYNVPGGCIV